MYHQARTCASSLTAARKLSSFLLPRVGARTLASAIASLGGLRVGPCGSGVGARSSLIPADRGGGAGPPPPLFSAAGGPGARPRLGEEQSRSVVLLSLWGRSRIAGAADGGPCFEGELVLAAGGGGGR